MSNSSESVQVEISADKYEAYITIAPDASPDVTVSRLNQILKERGVVTGVKYKVLQAVSDIYNKQGKRPQKLLVAEGVRPFEGKKPKIDLSFSFSSKPAEDESGRILYREVSNIISVQKDQLLATKQKPKQRVNGITVTGVKTVFPEIKDLPLIAGENVAKDDQENTIFFRAKVDGDLKYANDTLSVSPTLEIKGDVNFDTGNIHFDGDVVIHRDVLPGFLVESGGRVKVWGSVIAASISANGDVLIQAGVVGKNKGVIYTDGSIQATFVENAQLKAGDDIVVKNGIIGSRVYTRRYLSIESRRSRIVGCEVRANKGISCFNAGSRYCSNTRLITGVNAQKETEYKKIEGTYNQFVNEVQKIERKYGADNLKKNKIPRTLLKGSEEDVARWKGLKKKMQAISRAMKSVEKQVYDYGAAIRVRETLSPRVEVKIGNRSLKTTREHYNITVRYSEEEDKLVIL